MALLSFCSSNSCSDYAPNAMAIVSYAVICTVFVFADDAAVSLLTIQRIVHLGGMLKYYTVTGVFKPRN